MIYLLDTNVVSDLSRNHPLVVENRNRVLLNGDEIALCHPVYYEVTRGMLKINATTQLNRFREQFVPHVKWFDLEDEDWIQAAKFWASAKTAGRQLSDIDILLAAIAHRLDGVVVSSDADFDALPIRRESWRTPPTA